MAHAQDTQAEDVGAGPQASARDASGARHDREAWAEGRDAPFAKAFSFRILLGPDHDARASSAEWREESDGTRSLTIRRGIKDEDIVCSLEDEMRSVDHVEVEVLSRRPGPEKILRSYFVDFEGVMALGVTKLDAAADEIAVEEVRLTGATIVPTLA